MLDIAKEEVLQRYLLKKKHVKPGDSCNITYLHGGVSATVALVSINGADMIIKQALARLKVAEEWLCAPQRMQVEKKSNEVYHRLVPENVPAVYFYDEENFIFGREAASAQSVMWKADLMSGLLDFTVAEKVMDTLVTVHNACAKDKDVAAFFADKQVFYELRIEPYIEFTIGKHPHLAAIAKAVIDELMESAITLVHGDYSPKNVMLDGRKVFVTDFEVAHYGHPSFDLAFLSNHLILKAIHHRQYGAAYLSMLSHILNLYFHRMDFMDKKAMEQSFLKLLPLLMLARVDGKSPVEYITESAEKEFVRKTAFALTESGMFHRNDLIALVRRNIEKN